jgi:hypothetical protein
MNEEPSHEPENDARIRALLAELGSGPDGQSMPPEVAARLDDTLARLVAERGSTGLDADEQSHAGNVVPLRRRWLPRAAAAAAAVIVLGAGGLAAANLGVFGNDSFNAATGGGSSDSKADDSSAGTGAEAPNSESAGQDEGAATALPELSAGTFAADVAGLLQRRPAMTIEPPASGAPSAKPQQNRDAAKQGPADSRLSKECPGPSTSAGSVVHPVRYDGLPAVLVIHPEQGGRLLVQAWDCAGDRVLDSTTLTP